MPIPDLTIIGSAVSHANTALQMLKTIMSLRDQAMIQGELTKLYPVITNAHKEALAAYESQSAALKRVSELEAEIARLKDWEAKKQHYELYAVKPGMMVYAPKDRVPDAEPSHYLCTNCFDNEQTSIMQKKLVPKGRERLLVCPRCRLELNLTYSF